MTEEAIFKVVQKYVENVPLMLIGTGGTIPYGLPGMKELSQYLFDNLNETYKENLEWRKFTERLSAGIDLESALTDLLLDSDIIRDITHTTWQLVTNYDLMLLNKLIQTKTILPLAKLINKFFQPHPQCVNIITTNYDRVIEYACDQINVRADTKFEGNYIRYFSTSTLGTRNVVNILKVHGSLDLFKDKDNFIYSIPIQKEVPSGFTPEIIAPGSSKYRSVLQGTCRQVLHYSDSLINDARGYLCIGYGFNDEQIQANIISGIKLGKPIVVVTKEISDRAADLLLSNSTSCVIIQEGKDTPNTTQFIVNGNSMSVDGSYWTISGFMKIIE